ncbi:hypothetical protein [Chryseobacterium sp.]|uniref:hypothetical protein n=1 Tax=Chryseobacterium sp. TaxID=1871047 RepID=UPI00289F2B25|nr:hypothetical protein [Chryseobacterium sp.]
MNIKEYRAQFLKKINRNKIIAAILLGIFIVLVASFIIIYTFFDKQLQLPSYRYVLPLFVIQLIILVVTLILSISFFRSYGDVLATMNAEDLAILKQISESRSWPDKYLPSFIIYSGKIRVFTWLRQPEFHFTELKELTVKTNIFTRGKQNRLVIFNKVNWGSFFFAVDNNSAQKRHLIEKAVEYNPNIIIKGNMH